MRPDWPARDPSAATRSPSRSPSPQPSPSRAGGAGRTGGERAAAAAAGGGTRSSSRSISHVAAAASSGSNLSAANNGGSGRAPPPIGETPVPTNDNFKVVVRVRPPLPRELGHPRGYSPAVKVEACGRSLTLSEDPGVVSSTSSSSSSSSLGAESSNNNQHLLYATHRFAFDAVHAPSATQEEVYLASARPSVRAVLAGYNAAIIAYGQTGAGKTHTMEGEPEGEQRGIVPRAVADAFAGIEADDVAANGAGSGSSASSASSSSASPSSSSSTTPARFLVRASYLQIYNETISDLLKPERTNLAIREDARRGVFVEGLSEWVVRSPAEVHALMARGRAVRATGATRMNEASSRSHAVLTITIERCATTATATSGGEEGGGGLSSSSSTAASRNKKKDSSSAAAVRVGKLHLVDLAGSERVAITGATGKRLEESKRINASLSALGNVIAALTAHSSSSSSNSNDASSSSSSATTTTTSSSGRAPRSHIPYRDSKLTRLLEDSLGGNCVTTLVATVSPSSCAFSESLSTLKFATRAKAVNNAPRVNEELDGGDGDANSRTLLRRYEAELRRLRAELRERSRTLVDKRALLELEEGKRRAEADKLAAIEALEKRSAEVARAKAEKRALEARIGAMQSQLLVGGSLPLEGPGGRVLLRGRNGQPLSVEDTEQFRSRLDQEHRRIRGEYEQRLRELERDRQAAVADRAQADRYVALLLRQRDIMTGLTSRLAERDGQLSALREEVELYDGRIQRLEDALDARTAELLALRRAAAEREERGGEQGAAGGGRSREPSLSGGGGGGGGGGGQKKQQGRQQQQQQQQHPPPLPLPPTAYDDSTTTLKSAAERFASISLTARAVDETLPPAPTPPLEGMMTTAAKTTKTTATTTPSVAVSHLPPPSPSSSLPAPRSSSSSVSATPVAFVAAPPSSSSSSSGRRSSGGGSDVLRRLLG